MTDTADATGTDLTTDATLAEIVRRHPGSTRILEAHGLDYCCGGRRSLAEAAGAAGIDPAVVLDDLAATEPEPVPDWDGLGPAELADHIEGTHHAYLHAELGRLSALAAKVAGVHGDRHPELHEVARLYEALRADLEPHLLKEERVLFPMIRELAVADAPPSFHCGSLRNPISVMMGEHDTAGDLLERLRAATGGYATPADGCASYQALYEGLAQVEADTHLHVHKENNVLFPAVVALEDRLAAAG